MITPSYSITATERVLPLVDIDFTLATLDPRITFTRSGSTATVTNSSGVIVIAAADTPRFDFDPVTLVCRGLLIEESRTNVLLNSLINGSNLASQSVIVTAAARTLSFYGNGSITLSGAHSATVNGSGAYPSRTTLTFTPSEGILTLTVNGTVQFAQLEAGANALATSFIPTDGVAKTRNVDIASMTGANFSSWYNQSEGAFLTACQSQGRGAGNACVGICVSNGTTLTTMLSPQMVSNNVRTIVATDVLLTSQGTAFPTPLITVAFAYKVNNFAGATNGAFLQTDSLAPILTMSQIFIGSFNGSTGNQFLNGRISRLRYWPQRIINPEVQAFSK